MLLVNFNIHLYATVYVNIVAVFLQILKKLLLLVKKISFILTFFLPPSIVLVIALVNSRSAVHQEFTVEKGVLNLQDLKGYQNIFFLQGNFEFFNGKTLQYRKVPDTWSNDEAGFQNGMGFGTYRVHLKLPLDQQWAIKISTASTSWRLYLNGEKVASAGFPSANPDLAVAEFRYAIVPLPQQENVEVKIEVSNWEYRVGGLWRSPEIGPYSQMIQFQNARNYFSLGLSFSLAIITLLFIFGFLFLPKLPSFFFYSIICWLFSLRNLVTGDYLITQILPKLSFPLLIQLEYFTVYSTMPAIVFFLTILDAKLPYKKFLRFSTLVFLPFLIALFFLPINILTRTILPVSIIIFLISTILLVFLVYSVIRHKNTTAAFILSGGMAFFIAFVNDYLHNSFFIQSMNLLPFTNLIISVIFGAMILKQISNTLTSKELLSTELTETNQKLIKQIEMNYSSKQEIYHQVRNNLQIASSIINLEYQNLTKPEKNKIAVKAIQFRFIAMSLAQDKLFENIEESELDFVSFLKDFIYLIRNNLSLGNLEFLLSTNQATIFLSKELCRDLNLILMEFIIYHLENFANLNALNISLHVEEKKLTVKFKFQESNPKAKIVIRAQPSLNIMKNYARKYDMDFGMRTKGLEITLGINLPRSVQ